MREKGVLRRSGRAYQPRYSRPLPALIHWEVKVGGTGMKEVRGAVFAGSSPPFLGRERAAVDVDVGPERRDTPQPSLPRLIPLVPFSGPPGSCL